MTEAQEKAINVWDKEKRMVRDPAEQTPALNVAGAYLKDGISDFERRKYGDIETLLRKLAGDMSKGLSPADYWHKVYAIVIYGYQIA